MNSYNTRAVENQKITSSDVTRNSKKPRDIHLSTSTRWFIFVIFFLCGIIINMDHGTIPAATKEIKRDLKIDKDKLGMFGSLVFFGNFIGIYYNN
jgi:hypothetical protein